MNMTNGYQRFVSKMHKTRIYIKLIYATKLYIVIDFSVIFTWVCTLNLTNNILFQLKEKNARLIQVFLEKAWEYSKVNK